MCKSCERQDDDDDEDEDEAEEEVGDTKSCYPSAIFVAAILSVSLFFVLYSLLRRSSPAFILNDSLHERASGSIMHALCELCEFYNQK